MQTARCPRALASSTCPAAERRPLTVSLHPSPVTVLVTGLPALPPEPKEIRSEGTMQKQLLEKKFGTLTEKQRQLLFQFLQLVAGVEQQQQKFRSQASVIDEIVDTAFEAGEEDFRK